MSQVEGTLDQRVIDIIKKKLAEKNGNHDEDEVKIIELWVNKTVK
jgi:hypothetical protein